MGRGRSSFGGGGRGSSSFGGGGGSRSGHSHTTVFVGGGRRYYHGGGGGSPIIGLVVGAIFAFVGTITVLMGIIQCVQIANYAKVTAVCVDNEYSPMDGYYYSIYDFTVDGKFYDDVRSNQGWQFEEKINKEVTIYYQKSDPNQISEECPISIMENLIIIGAGLLFAGVGCVPIFLCIKELKAGKNSASADKSSVPEETHVTCNYCGARFSKKSSNCPKCGASKPD